MRIIQYLGVDGARRVGVVRDATTIDALTGEQSIRSLALEAIRNERSLSQVISERTSERQVDYEMLIEERRLLPPVDHSDPAHMLISGTGLTHLGSADARDQMHKAGQAHDAPLTDSMRMFQMGLENGKPEPGALGAQPEWFYKGDGSIVTPPYRPILSPSFALDGGEEPEIAGLYVIGMDGTLQAATVRLRAGAADRGAAEARPGHVADLTRRHRHLGAAVPQRRTQYVAHHRQPGGPPLQIPAIPPPR
jgi:hypothetical protein